MADDKVAETETAEQTPVTVEASVEPEEAAQTEASKDGAEEAAGSGSADADPVEDTYESVAAPADSAKADPEKTNGTAAAEGIEVPLDENEAAAQPLTGGEKDVEAAETPKDKSPSLAAHVRILNALKKREILFPVIGGVTFLLGLILIITALMIMQGKCDRATPENSQMVALGKDDDSVRYADRGHMTSHDHDGNSTLDDSELENLAEGKPAFQSTTFMEKGISLNASLATDGNTGNSMTKNECAQTERQENPEWHVDLGEDHVVNRIKIYIPSNCCVGELHDFVVRVGSDSDLSMNAQCKHYMGTALRPAISMQCDETLTGRFVSIHMLGDEARTRDRLSICEVLVYSR